MTIKVSFVAPNFRQGPVEFNAFYLPYSPGVIWSYCYQFKSIKEKFKLDKFIWRRDPIEFVVNQLKNSHIIGFSTYIWNRNYNFELAKRIKNLNPNILIVFGGPEPPVEKPNFFELYPYIDLCIKKEGELVFRNILENYITKNFSHIKGLLINDNNSTIDTGEADRISNLDEIPSPYLTGLFDDLIKEHPNVTWNATLETNRGCPYACTFCDWGSLTYNKIKQFDLNRVFQELEWFAKNNIDFLSITDANFGIFTERDNSIADKLIEVKNKYGFPKTYNVSWAKNQKKEVVQIVKKLINDGDLKTGLNLSVQTLDETTLDTIKRKNLETHKIEEIFTLCEENNIPLFTELILGLPGQTLESFKNDFYKLYEIGNHTGISVYQAQLLENAEMNLLQRKLHKIKGVQVYDYIHGSHHENEIEESVEVVVATKNLPPELMIEAQIFGWYMNTFHINGLTNIISRFIRKHINVTYKEFYESFFNFIKDDLWIQKEINRIKYYYKQWATHGRINHPSIQNIEIHGFNLIHTTIINMHVENKYEHVFKLIDNFLKTTYILERDIFDDLKLLQQNVIINYSNIQSYPFTKQFNHDILGYINGKELNIEHIYTFDFPENKLMSLQQFCESLFFARRRNFGKSYITKNILIEKDINE